MTLPYERRRALEWAGDLLREIFQESKEVERWGAPIPPKLREAASRILRHYPQPSEIRDAANMDNVAACHWISEEPSDREPKLDAELHRRILNQTGIQASTYEGAMQRLDEVQQQRKNAQQANDKKDQ